MCVESRRRDAQPSMLAPAPMQRGPDQTSDCSAISGASSASNPTPHRRLEPDGPARQPDGAKGPVAAVHRPDVDAGTPGCRATVQQHPLSRGPLLRQLRRSETTASPGGPIGITMSGGTPAAVTSRKCSSPARDCSPMPQGEPRNPGPLGSPPATTDGPARGIFRRRPPPARRCRTGSAARPEVTCPVRRSRRARAPAAARRTPASPSDLRPA